MKPHAVLESMWQGLTAAEPSIRVIYSSLPPSLRFPSSSLLISITGKPSFCMGVYPDSQPEIHFEGLVYMAWRLAPPCLVHCGEYSCWHLEGLFLKRQLLQNTFRRGSAFLLSDYPWSKQMQEGGDRYSTIPVSIHETENAFSHLLQQWGELTPSPTRL